MDPKTAPVLDPKLKEAYDRVMNTPVTPPAQPNPPTPPPPSQPITPPQTPVPTPPPPVTPPAPPVEPQPLPADPQPSPPPWSPPVKPVSPPAPPPTTTVHATIPLASQPKPASATIVAALSKQSGKGLRLFPILFAVGGLLFFAVYTVFWLKFFNLSIPFLPF